MKKFLAIFTIISIMTFAGCSNDEEDAITEATDEATEIEAEETPAEETENDTADEPGEAAVEAVEINVGVIQGPSAMGLVVVMDEAENEDAVYNFTLVGSPDAVVPDIVQGNFDIAAVPPNIASILYNNTDGEIQVIAIGTLGVLYIVEAGDEITSVEDLQGRTIYASGAGGAPEFVLNYILEGNGIDPDNDVNIEWLAEHTEVASRMAISEDGVAMLPQPFVTVAMTENEDLRIALDLTEEWDQVQALDDGPTSALVMGVIVARREFIDQNPEAVENFLDRFEDSVQFVNGDIEEAAQLIEEFDIFPAPIATRALPYSNITFIEGTEMEELLSGFLQVLFEQNPESIGGEMPSEEFYYIQ